jgi:hypothetical protein
MGNLHAFKSFDILGLKRYIPVLKHKKDTQEKFKNVLMPEKCTPDELRLYHTFFTLLQQKINSSNSDEFLNSLWKDKEKKATQNILEFAWDLPTYHLYKDIKVAYQLDKQQDAHKSAKFVKVINFIYEQLPPPMMRAYPLQVKKKFNELIEEPEFRKIYEFIELNSEWTEEEKKIQIDQLNREIEQLAFQECGRIVCELWKPRLSSYCSNLQKSIPIKATDNISPEQQKSFDDARKNYKKERDKYVLIERGDYVLKKYNEFCMKKSSELKDLENLAKKNQEPVQQQWENINKLFDSMKIEANFSWDEFQKQWRQFVLKNHPDKINAKENYQNVEANNLVMQNANELKPIVESIKLSHPKKIFNRYLIRQDWLKENSVSENYSNEQLIEHAEKFTKFVQEVGIEAQKNEVNNKWKEERKRIDSLIRNNNRVLTYDLPPIKPYNLGIKSVPQLKLPQSELERMEYEQLWSFWNQYFPNQNPKKPKRNIRAFSDLFEITQNPDNELNENKNDNQH